MRPTSSLRRVVVGSAALALVGTLTTGRASAQDVSGPVDLRPPSAWKAGETVTETETFEATRTAAGGTTKLARESTVVWKCTSAAKDGTPAKAVLHVVAWLTRDGASEDRSLEGALVEARRDGWTLLRSPAPPSPAAKEWLAAFARPFTSGEGFAADVVPPEPVAARATWKVRGADPAVPLLRRLGLDEGRGHEVRCSLGAATASASGTSVRIDVETASVGALSASKLTAKVEGAPAAWHRTASTSALAHWETSVAAADGSATPVAVDATRTTRSAAGGDVPAGTPAGWLVEAALEKAAKGDAAGAAESLDLAISIDPLHAPAWCERGRVRASRRDLDGAIEDFTRAIETDPRYAKAWSARAAARSAGGDAEGAVADWTQAVKLDPADARSWHLRGIAYAAQKENDLALADLTKAVELDPANADAFLRRGILHGLKGAFDAAIADYSKVIELEPANVRAWNNRGNARDLKGDAEGAIADYAKACELDPTSAAAWFNKGRALAAKGDSEAAIADCTKALELNPQHASAHNTRGNCKDQLGDVEGAVQDWTAALAIDPKHPYAQYSLARAWFRPGQPLPRVVDGFRRAAELAPNSDYQRLWLWIARTRAGERDAASAEMQEYLAQRKPAADDWWLVLAKMLTGDLVPDNALAQSLTNDPKTSAERLCEATFFAGMVYASRGDVAMAVELMDRALATNVRTYVEHIEARRWRPALMLGATTRPVAPAPKPAAVAKTGVVVVVVPEPNGPAARAGLADGDAVTKIDGQPAKPGQLEQLLLTAPPGTKVKLEVVRKGRTVKAEVLLGASAPAAPKK